MDIEGGDRPSADEVYGESKHPDFIAGYLEVPKHEIIGDPNNIFNDKRRLKGSLRHLVHKLHDEEKVIFARFTGHKGLVITVIGAASFAAGMVGIGVRVRRKGERKR